MAGSQPVYYGQPEDLKALQLFGAPRGFSFLSEWQLVSTLDR